MTRRRAHIAMIGTSFLGHVIPSAAVLSELVARGHRVSAANEQAVAHLLTETGAEFVPVVRRLPDDGGAWVQDPVSALSVLLDCNMQVLPQVRAVYDEDPADLYLYDTGAYAGRALADAQGRPSVLLTPSVVALNLDSEVSTERETTELPGAAAYEERFAKWLAESGAATTDVDEFTGRRRTIALISKVLQPHAERLDPDEVTFAGPCFRGRESQGSWTRPEQAEKVLLISLGSSFTRQPAFYRSCVAAFGDLPGWHVVLSIGKHVNPSELGAVPANIEVHDWVPQLSVLGQADAFVTHAGTGGCAEALFHGVPMVVVPQGADHFSNADLLVERGVARRIDTADATAQTLRDAVTELVADPSVRDRLTALRAEVRSEGGAARAADIIEAMLE
ncbi:macrolide family glycosyltransferase [Streptomyces sp. NPDC002746]